MNTRQKLEALGKKYFNAFEHKDISVISDIFDENVQLTDPFIKTIYGKPNVLAANSDIFKDNSIIKFTKCEVFTDEKNNTIIGELEILLNSTRIEVVDIIKVNKDLLITSITAYINPVKD
jgi:hypothetical protein